MSKKDIKGISQLSLYRNFSKIDNSIFMKAGLSTNDIEWIKKRISKNPKGFLFDFKELDNGNKLSSNYFVFKELSELSINKKDKNNHLLIEGDNYEALSALKSTGIRVDAIYIDPPYNTGKEFIYSDDYSTNPKPVGNDDVHKHSKWLSFIKKRLILAKELLSDEGVIFISIDDNEQAYLKVLMDEIFGEDNFISNMPRPTSIQNKNNIKTIASSHDYVLVYSKLNKFNKRKFDIDKNEYKYEDEKGRYKQNRNTVSKTGKNTWPISIKGIKYYPVYGKYGDKKGSWNFSIDKKDELICNDGFIINGNKLYTKTYENAERPYRSVDLIDTFFDKLSSQTTPFGSVKGTNEIKEFGLKFDQPKSVSLIKELIRMHPKKDVTILDFFAGSGTTGQAVMELNREDGGNRRFILVTNNERSGYDTKANPEYGIARAITRERLFMSINGRGSNNEKINWELPKDLQNETEKYLSENSVNYLKVKTIHKVNGEFEEIENIKNLYNNEFNKENFSIVELENE